MPTPTGTVTDSISTAAAFKAIDGKDFNVTLGSGTAYLCKVSYPDNDADSPAARGDRERDSASAGPPFLASRARRSRWSVTSW